MIYIYNVDTLEVVATANTFEDVEYNYDWDLYGATESPAFGFDGGLV
jgi:hypothetical protein